MLQKNAFGPSSASCRLYKNVALKLSRNTRAPITAEERRVLVAAAEVWQKLENEQKGIGN